MGKRIKKPPVRPEVRREWLRRYDVEGESPPQIAAKDGFDVRTVRKQIEQAQREREIKESRLMVLRNAIESHYGDLVDFAKQLDSHISGEAPITDPLRNNPLWLALRQHLPHSLLWKGFDRWDNLLEKIDTLKKDSKVRLEKEIAGDAKLRPVLASGSSGVIPGMTEALAFQMEQWARGAKGLSIDDDFRVKSVEDDLVDIEYGAFPMGKTESQYAAIIKDVLVHRESKVTSREVYDEMSRLFEELKRVQSKLRDEIATIKLRRVVPGRCKYCPI